MSRVPQNLIQKTVSLATAVLSGKRIPADRIRRRVEICACCRYVRVRKRARQKLRCGICGCRLRGRRALINLAAYEETARYGCKHPKGSRWKSRGV